MCDPYTRWTAGIRRFLGVVEVDDEDVEVDARRSRCCDSEWECCDSVLVALLDSFSLYDKTGWGAVEMSTKRAMKQQ